MKRLGIGVALILTLAFPAVADEARERLAAQGRLVDAARVKNLPGRPDDAGWDVIAPVRLTLYPQSAITPGLRPAGPVEIRARVAQSGDRLAVRLDWEDATRDGFRDDDTASFADAAAVQFASLGQPARLPYIGMGEPGRPVGLWHWRAGTASAQVLEAEGFGSLRPATAPVPTAIAAWRQGGWRVVLSGPPPVRTGGLIPIAVAVWDGAAQGRAGRKWLSAWILVRTPGATDNPATYRAMLEESRSNGDATRGAAVARDLGCNTCHTLPGGQPAEAGPDLSYAGGHHWPGYLRRSITSPSEFIVPQGLFATEQGGRRVSTMPVFDLDAARREDLVSFLSSLR